MLYPNEYPKSDFLGIRRYCFKSLGVMFSGRMKRSSGVGKVACMMFFERRLPKGMVGFDGSTMRFCGVGRVTGVESIDISCLLMRTV